MRDKEIMSKQTKLKDSHDIELQLIKQDYEKQMQTAKKKIKTLEKELSEERNSISTKEEMLYSMADNMLSEFQDFNNGQSTRTVKSKKANLKNSQNQLQIAQMQSSMRSSKTQSSLSLKK